MNNDTPVREMTENEKFYVSELIDFDKSLVHVQAANGQIMSVELGTIGMVGLPGYDRDYSIEVPVPVTDENGEQVVNDDGSAAYQTDENGDFIKQIEEGTRTVGDKAHFMLCIGISELYAKVTPDVPENMENLRVLSWDEFNCVRSRFIAHRNRG